MPYVTEDKKVYLGKSPSLWESDTLNEAVGELNFRISALIDCFIYTYGKKYAVMNGAIGALECAKLELYRRIVADYEDKKMLENGDIYSVENLTNNQNKVY